MSEKNVCGYRWLPGAHCSSSALRDLISHHTGLCLSEAVVFGLGGGCSFLSVPVDEDHWFFNGRSASFLPDLAWALGLDYVEHHPSTDEEAWASLRHRVSIEKKPAILFGDTFHLPHEPNYGISHFPAHTFVCVGASKDAAFIVERWSSEILDVPLENLTLSRNTPGYTMSVNNLWATLGDTLPRHTLHVACKRALARQAERMVHESGHDGGMIVGISGLRRFAALLQGWAASQTVSDARRIRTIAWVFEKGGTGGANFRRLFAEFLSEARGLCRGHFDIPESWTAAAFESANLFTRFHELALLLDLDTNADRASTNNSLVWGRLQEVVCQIVRVESALFGQIWAALELEHTASHHSRL